MGAPSVPYIMLTDGYKVTSGSNGFAAKASFLCQWADAFTFHDDIMGFSTAAVVGPLTYNTPWQFPGSTSARLYASSCEITPSALAGGAAEIGAALGMAPGEYWSHAIIAVTFETPPLAQSAADDPGGVKQLDPANPLYGCEQAVRLGGKSVTWKKEDWVMSEGGGPPADDLTVFVPEANLTLHYASVPYLAWRKYRPYVGTLNDATFLDCPAGQLMFEGVDIQPGAGAQGVLTYSMTLNLAYSEYDWNMVPAPGTGVPGLVHRKGGTRKLYTYKTFQDLLL